MDIWDQAEARKDEILELRGRGFIVVKIAKELGLDLDAVGYIVLRDDWSNNVPKTKRFDQNRGIRYSQDREYSMARHEHAFLLRMEGFPTFDEIGEHLDISGPRARQLVGAFAKKLNRAMRKTRWTFSA